MAKTKLLNVFFMILCSTGFLYQMTEISLEYFAFETTTRVTFQIDAHFNDPAIVFCTRYTDIIDRTHYRKYGIYNESRYNYTEILSDNSNLTISHIFQLTPDPSDAMISCYLRENDYGIQGYSRDQCYELFQVTKYQEGAFICYLFRTKNVDSKFNCDKAALAYINMNDMYIISLHPRFKQSNSVKLISFIPSRHSNPILNLPGTSRRYYSFILRYGNDFSQSFKRNYFQISGDVYSITRLERPYDTNCMKNPEKSDFACYRRCNIAAFKTHNLFPSNEFTIEPLPMKHMNTKAVSNKTLLQDVKIKSNICQEKCKQKSCYDPYSVTSISVSGNLRNDRVSIVSSCSNRPATIIQFVPKISFMEFILYISSSLGIWFGISIFSINPFKNSRMKLMAIIKQTSNANTEFNECRGLTVNELGILYHNLHRRFKKIEHIIHNNR